MRPYVLACLGLAFAAFSPVATAQTPDNPIETCRAAHGDDAGARIACLERAIEAMRAQPASRPSAPETTADRPGWSIPGFRAQSATREDERVRVQIVRIRYGRDGYGIFSTDNGQVWRETVPAPRRRHLDPAQSYEAVIHRNALGGFRMNVDGIRWEYKVEPLN